MRRFVVAAAVVLLLGGCGDGQPDVFEPAKARPCAFFTAEELEKYALVVKIDEAGRCYFGKQERAEDLLTEVTVEYRAETPDTVAAALRLTPVAGKEAEETKVTYKGSEKPGPYDDPLKGTCRLLAPIGKDHTLYVAIGTDTSGIHGSMEAAERTEPCAALANKYGRPEILAKLRR